jgi:hypothetical protein
MKRWLPHDADVPEDPVERSTYYLATARAELLTKDSGLASRIGHLRLVPDDTVVPIHFNETTFRFNPTYVLRASEEELAEIWRDVAVHLKPK